MQSKIFGTDGVRGPANRPPMTPTTVMALALAAGAHFRQGDHRHRVIVGKDTRRGNYMVENALSSGFSAMGMDVFKLGPLQTSGVAILTRSLRADIGVMITASHNPHSDLGIKFFNSRGYKLSCDTQAQIEARMGDSVQPFLAKPMEIGHVEQLETGSARYIEFAKATFPRALRLDGIKVVVDCANGAAYKTAPLVFWELGATVIPVGVDPDGYNINRDCGSTAPETARQAVLSNRADLGVVLDGDGDRVHLIDEHGEVLDGDHILATVAAYYLAENRVLGGAVVGTEMSNRGLELFLNSRKLQLCRTRVGDRFVVERMLEMGCNLGGEQSGHIVLADFVSTGDGVVAALQVMAAMMRANRPASEVCRPFEPWPQITRSVEIAHPEVVDDPSFRSVIRAMRARLEPEGRLVVRCSGTEPKVRVMGEHSDRDVVEGVVAEMCEEIARVAA